MTHVRIEALRLRMDKAVRKHGRKSTEAETLRLEIEIMITRAQRSGKIGTFNVGDDPEEDGE